MQPRIRDATACDLPDILAILNREILEGIAHFGTEPMSLEELAAEFGSKTKYPWIVAEQDGSVLGFARASPWKRRGAYANTAEVGVYVRPEFQGRGIGKAIYTDFVPRSFETGLHTLLAGISLPNPPSIRLHEAFGFRHVGTLPQVGFKFGKWIDVGYWALIRP